MHPKLIFIEEIFGTETAIRMHEGHIAELVDVSFLHVAVQGFESVQFLLLQYTSLLLYAYLAV